MPRKRGKGPRARMLPPPRAARRRAAQPRGCNPPMPTVREAAPATDRTLAAGRSKGYHGAERPQARSRSERLVPPKRRQVPEEGPKRGGVRAFALSVAGAKEVASFASSPTVVRNRHSGDRSRRCRRRSWNAAVVPRSTHPLRATQRRDRAATAESQTLIWSSPMSNPPRKHGRADFLRVARRR